MYGIRRKDVTYLIKRCAIYNFQRPSNTKAPLQPVIVERVMERLQIDLIDMRHSPDGRFKWILHIKDHFSKYTALFALRSKEASAVADKLADFLMFAGPPEIVQMDNGKEFKGVCLLLLKRFGIRIVNDRSRRPQTQGLVEQANGVAKTKLAAYLREMGSTTWASALPSVAMGMNKQPHRSLPRRITPFEVFFSRQIIGLDRADHNNRLALFQLSDDDINKFCTSEDPHPILDRLIADLPQKDIDEDSKENNTEDEDEEVTIAKQVVKELRLDAASQPIDPSLFVSL